MRMIKKKTLNSENWILLLLFFLAAMNFQAKFFYFVFAAFAVHCLIHKNFKADRSILWYILFTAVYVVYSYDDGWLAVIRKFSFIGCYILGYNTIVSFTKNRAYDYESQRVWLKACIVTISTGSWTHMMLNFFINMGNSAVRNTIDIWTGETMAATGQAAFGVLMIATGIVCFLIPKRNSEMIFAAISVTLVNFYNLILGGRTIIFLSAIILLLTLFMIIKDKGGLLYYKKKTIVIVAVSFFALMIYMLIGFESMIEKLSQTNLYERFSGVESGYGLIEDGRMDKIKLFLGDMHNYLFGGQNMKNKYGYAHNIILDAYDECGIFMAIPLIAILIKSIRDAKKCLKIKCMNIQMRCLVLCAFVSMFAIFFLEPIFAGMPWMFACFSLLSGCIRGVVYTHGN